MVRPKAVQPKTFRPKIFQQRIVRRKNERVEVRFFGGQDYHKKFDTFKRVLSELLYAFDVATDPENEKQKYQKKVFRLLNTINKSKDK